MNIHTYLHTLCIESNEAHLHLCVLEGVGLTSEGVPYHSNPATLHITANVWSIQVGSKATLEPPSTSIINVGAANTVVVIVSIPCGELHFIMIIETVPSRP